MLQYRKEKNYLGECHNIALISVEKTFWFGFAF